MSPWLKRFWGFSKAKKGCCVKIESSCGYHPLLQRTVSDVNTPTTATPDFPTGMRADIQANCWGPAARRARQQPAWQNVPAARWAQEKAGPSSCWVGIDGTGKTWHFLGRGQMALWANQGPALPRASFLPADRSCIALLNHQWMPVP